MGEVMTLTRPGREPPHNPEAEQGLLAAIMANNAVYAKVAAFLQADHFADPIHGRIFAACGTLISQNRAADPITLKREFDQDDALSDVGGAQYLVRLVGSVVTLSNAVDYAREIHDCWIRRQLIDLGTGVVAAAHAPDLPGPDQIRAVESKLYDLSSSASSGVVSGLMSVGTGLDEALSHIDLVAERGLEAASVATGISSLDRRLLMMPGQMIVLAGRPAMGKTALALRIARNVSRRGLPVAMFSLEMTRAELGMRLLAAETSIPVNRQQRGEVDENDRRRLQQARDMIAGWPLQIDDTPASTVREIRNRAMKLKKRHGLALAVVDYLQLIAPGNSQQNRQSNRTSDVTEISQSLKALAKELDAPVLALAQLSRAVEMRENKRPQLSDLRDSGAIEQDADSVAFVFREFEYVKDEEPRRKGSQSGEAYQADLAHWAERRDSLEHVMEVIVAKNRHAPTGWTRLYADMASGRIETLQQEHR